MVQSTVSHSAKRIVGIVIILCGMAGSFVFVRIRPAFAQTIQSELRDFLVTKAGFTFLNDASSDFQFFRITPNYTAYAGNTVPGSTNQVRLSFNRYIVDWSLLTVSSLAYAGTQTNLIPIPEASDSADPRQVLERIRLLDEQITAISQENNILLSEFRDHPIGATLSGKMVETPQERIVVFPGVTESIDLRYRLNEGGIDEEVVIKNSNSRVRVFVYALDTHGLSARNMGGGVWYLFDGSTPLFRLPKGWATDASGAFTNDVICTVEDGLVFVSVDADWMYASERVYPIVVHASVEVVPEKRGTHNETN